jgi:hypothetical protein
MSRPHATPLRVEYGKDDSVRLVGPGFERLISLSDLAGLARLLCRARRRNANQVQTFCVTKDDREDRRAA